MTTSTSSRTMTGSLMAPKLAPLPTSGHLRVGNWLTSTAGYYRVSVSTAKGWLYGDRSVWNVAKMALRQMVLHGDRDLADEKFVDLEQAFIGAPTEALPEVILAKAALDGAEDVRRTAYLLDPCTAEHRALRRSVVQEITAAQRLLKALDIQRECH